MKRLRYEPIVEETPVAFVWMIVDHGLDDVLRMGAALTQGDAWEEMEDVWCGFCIDGTIDPEDTIEVIEPEHNNIWKELKDDEER